MKTITKFMLLIVAAMFLAACAPAAAPEPAPAPAAPATTEAPAATADAPATDDMLDASIAFVTPAAEHGWLAGVIFFANQRAAELGLSNFSIHLSTSVAEQAGQLDLLIGQNVDAIVLMPHTDELTVAAQNVLDAGIPLVVFNRNVNVDFDARIVGSNAQIGQNSARTIGEYLGGQGRVAVLHNPSAGSTSVDRTSAFMEVIEAEFPEIETFDITVENFTQLAALQTGNDVFQANPEGTIDGIFSIDDESSLGLLQAIREAGRNDVQIMSGGGGAQSYFREIDTERDLFLFSATFSPRMAGDSVEVALQILRGEATGVDADNLIIVESSIVDRYNVSGWFADDSPY